MTLDSRQEVLVYSLVILIFLISILFFTLMKTRKLKFELEKERKVNDDRINKILKEKESKYMKLMIENQEDERKRIAQDLHDRLGSMLSVAKMYYEDLKNSLHLFDPSSRKNYLKANDILDEVCEGIRYVAYDMTLKHVLKLGLEASLLELKKTLEELNLFKVELVVHGLDRHLGDKLKIEVYGIIQELTHNVIKHSKANELTIQIAIIGKKLRIEIIDDGVGFKVVESELANGMGLKNVQSRVNNLLGEITIDSRIDIGTTIIIEIPLIHVDK